MPVISMKLEKKEINKKKKRSRVQKEKR